MKHRQAIVTCCVLCVVVLAAGSCSPAADQDLTDAAVTAAEAWLGVADSGQYGVSWDQSAAVFQSAMSRAGWEQSLGFARKPLGDLVSRELKSAKYATSLPSAPDGQYVVIQFTTVFANKKSAIETVTPMKESDGIWRVSGYYIK